MKKLPFFDLVICGPDMSGTSSQIRYLMNYLQSKGYKIGDMRGNEKDALFHAEQFNRINKKFPTYNDFRKNVVAEFFDRINFNDVVDDLMDNLKIATFAKNKDVNQKNKMTYINPEKSDLWIFEEPTRRGAGQVCRTTEQNMSFFHRELNPVSASVTHSVYRLDEFLRFREFLIDLKIPIIRSRSEESGAYQIKDLKTFSNGIKRHKYLNLPGHKIAFSNPPTDIFIVHAPENWTKKDYLKLKKERSNGRILDDHELNPDYQIMVNKRYATNWMEEFYEEGCQIYGSKVPNIYRFDIYADEPTMEKEMISVLEEKVLKVV